MTGEKSPKLCVGFLRSHFHVSDDLLSDETLGIAYNLEPRLPQRSPRIHTKSLREYLKIPGVSSTIWLFTRPHLLRLSGYEEHPPTHRSATNLAERGGWTVMDNDEGNTNNQTIPKDTLLVMVAKVPQRQMYGMCEE
jgi:hypothetical protein